MLAAYLKQGEQLVNVFVLIDIRHDQQKIDREFVDWLGQSQVPFCIVFTKADKLGVMKAQENAKRWMNALLDSWEELPPYFITSAEKKTGRDEVLDYIDKITQSLEVEEEVTAEEEAVAEAEEEVTDTEAKEMEGETV